MEEKHAQERNVDEDMWAEERKEVGSGSSDADSRYAYELRDAIAQQMWDGYHFLSDLFVRTSWDVLDWIVETIYLYLTELP